MHHIQFFSHHLSCLIQEEGLATQNQEKRELCTGSRKASVLTGALLLSREKIYAKKCFYYLYVNVIFNCRQHIIQHSSGWLWSAISAPIILESSENYVSGQFPQEKVKFWDLWLITRELSLDGLTLTHKWLFYKGGCLTSYEFPNNNTKQFTLVHKDGMMYF